MNAYRAAIRAGSGINAMSSDDDIPFAEDGTTTGVTAATLVGNLMRELTCMNKISFYHVMLLRRIVTISNVILTYLGQHQFHR